MDALTLMNQGTLGLIPPQSGVPNCAGDHTAPLSSSGVNWSRPQVSAHGYGSSPLSPAGPYGIPRQGEASAANLRDQGRQVTGGNTLYEGTATVESPVGHPDYPNDRARDYRDQSPPAQSPLKAGKRDGENRLDTEIQSTLKRQRHSPSGAIHEESPLPPGPTLDRE